MDRPDALPWAQIPHWIMLAPISAEAKVIYGLLTMHVNREDPANRKAWPLRETLAELAGYSRPQTVDKYIRELEAFGAVKVVRGRHPTQPLLRRNHYFVVLATDPAPMSVVGDLSLVDFYRRTDHEDAGRVGGAPERTSGEQAADIEAEAVESEAVSDPEVRSGAPREVRESAPREVRQSAQELEELELDQRELEQEDLLWSRTNLDSLVETPIQDPNDLPVVVEKPRPNVSLGNCGMNKCQNGMYVYNLAGDRRRCTICNPRVKADAAA